MKRDMDKVRAILLALENSPEPFFMSDDISEITGITDTREIVGYVNMLASGGLLETTKSGVYKMSWAGHEFLDSVRDPGIWKSTKAGAGKVGSWSIKLLSDLALGFARRKAIDLGLPLA